MAINNALLISAPVLQNYLVDGQGNPLANGTITFFQDSARTILKNVYFQSSNTGGYQYLTLPNPLTVSGAGLIVDATGSPTDPFYYPYSETDNKTPQSYYITVVDQNGLTVNTLQNFPFNPNAGGGTPSTVAVASNQNLVCNGSFWRNVGSMALSGVTNAVVAPSYHDGYVFNGSATATIQAVSGSQTVPAGGEIMFLKNNTSATETITFNTFSPSVTPLLTGDVNPEFYLTHECTVAGIGELFKFYQFPISLHVANLANAEFTISIEAQGLSSGGALSNTINFYLYQYAGTSGSGSNITLINSTAQALNASWTKYTASFIFPAASGLTLSATGDDAFFLEIGMPINTACMINFTLPSLYLVPATIPVPTNYFNNYDVVNSVISSPRTGDIRVALNNYPSPSNFGWCPMNDGVIGNNTTYSTNPYFARNAKDTWPLFNLLWQHFKPYDMGSGGHFNPISQMFTTASISVLNRADYGASAYADFVAGNAIQLTAAMGQVLMGTVPLTSLLPAQAPTTNTGIGYSSVVTASSSTGLLLTNASSDVLGIFQGAPIIFTNTGGSLPTGIAANTIYYAVPISTTTFKIATSFANALTSTVVAYTNAGSGTTTVYFGAAGMGEGEYAHTQLGTEVGLHQHQLQVFAANGTSAAAFHSNATTSAGFETTTQNSGGGQPFNITQPSLFTNFYIKL